MQFAVFSLMQSPEDRSQSDVFRNEMDQLIESEAQGYDAVWLAEHHFSRYGLAGSTHLNAAYLAARTQRIRIGTAVTIVPFLHPIRIAEEIAMLDRLSNGRIDWGAGRGYQGHEFSGFGVDCAIVGDAGFCRERVAELRERIRLDHLIAWQNFGDLPHEATRASQRRFIEKVAPAFA